MNIIQKPSPNQDGNRVKIDRILIHWFGVGNLASTDATFAKPNGTSAHYAIEDEQVHQYVQENRVAYHAGNYAFNQRSIGIEHSATPDRPASPTTYLTSGLLVSQIAKRHNIPLDREHIKRHGEIVPTQCCGTVDIDKIIAIAKGIDSGQMPIDPILQQKASGFDRVWQPFLFNGQTPESAKEVDHLAFVLWIKSNVKRAGMWDQLAIKAGLGGDTTLITVDKMFNTIKAQGGSTTKLKNEILEVLKKY